jgi:hypothetical protein
MIAEKASDIIRADQRAARGISAATPIERR